MAFSSIDFSAQPRKARVNNNVKTRFLYILNKFYSILIILFLGSQQLIVNNSFSNQLKHLIYCIN